MSFENLLFFYFVFFPALEVDHAVDGQKRSRSHDEESSLSVDRHSVDYFNAKRLKLTKWQRMHFEKFQASP